MKQNEVGFTLIHFVILIAIIGILAAVILPKYITVPSNSETAETTIDADASSP